MDLQGTWRAGRWEAVVLGKRAVLKEVALRMVGWDLEVPGLWKKEAERQAELEGRTVEKPVVELEAEWGQWRRKVGQHFGKAAGQVVELCSITEEEPELQLQQAEAVREQWKRVGK